MTNQFKCRANNSGYCSMWLRECVGADNCKQGYCPYCIHSAISPKECSICNDCEHFEWKRENYVE